VAASHHRSPPARRIPALPPRQRHQPRVATPAATLDWKYCAADDHLAADRVAFAAGRRGDSRRRGDGLDDLLWVRNGDGPRPTAKTGRSLPAIWLACPCSSVTRQGLQR
jgi:hypothetical protein